MTVAFFNKMFARNTEAEHLLSSASGRENKSNTHPLILSPATDVAHGQLQSYGSSL